MLAARNAERQALDAVDDAVLAVRERRRGDVAGQRRDRRRGIVEEPLVDHACRLELRDDLLVLDPDVLLRRVPGEQFLPRAQDVLVRGEHRDQRAQRQAPLDDEVAAGRIEEERRDLREEIVQELDEELALEDVVADRVDLPEPMADVGALELQRVVAADLGKARDRFADAIGQLARRLHALLREQVDRPLQLRNQVDLRRVEGDRRQSQPEVLVEDEHDVRHEQAALENRQHDRIADEAADGFRLRDDHRNDLAGGHRLELRQRKAQHLVVEIVAQPAQRPLADDAGVDVDPILERPVDRDEREQQHRQRHQVRDLGDGKAEKGLGKMLPLDRVVDDALRQFQVDVDQREADAGQREQDDLVPPGVPEDIAEE